MLNIDWMSERGDHTKNIPSHPIVNIIPIHENTIVNTTTTPPKFLFNVNKSKNLFTGNFV